MQKRTPPRMATCLFSALALIIVPLLTGCGSYTIKGRVIRGPAPAIQLVSSSDRRLKETNGTGSGAAVAAILEPDTPTERVDLGTYITDEQGWFEIPVNAFGSGFLEYEAMFIAQRDGNQGAMQTLDLPRRGQRVLITLPLGANNVKRPERFIDDVFKDAEPYLKQDR